MSNNTSSADYGRFDELAEEFAARYRRGERPSLQEYIDRCPALADEITSGALRIDARAVPLADVTSAWKDTDSAERIVLTP